MNRERLTAKLNAYGVGKVSLNLRSYLITKKQTRKINLLYSEFEEVISGVPQGSIFGRLLFHRYICDVF